jgi:hypothetical protein
VSNARGGRVCLFLGPLALVLRVAGADPVPDAELARCAAVSSPSERLTCYDTLAGRARKESPAGASPSASQHSSAAPASTAPQSMPTGGASAAGSVSAAAAIASLAPSDDASRFGLPPPPSVTPGPSKIEARVARVSADAQGNFTLTLDNGQLWSVQQGDQWLQSGDTVTIRQAALSSYLLTTPTRHSYRVRRLQ